MKKVLETAMILMGTLGFWGFVYPEFCLTEETYKVETVDEYESADGGEFAAGYEDADGYETSEDGTKKNQIVVKSKLLEYLFSIKETCEDTGADIF